MISSIIGGIVITLLLFFTYIIGDRKGFSRGLKRGATEMNKYIMDKYEGYVMLTKEGFQSLTGYTVDEYHAAQDMFNMSKEEQPEAKVSHLKAVKEDEDEGST